MSTASNVPRYLFRAYSPASEGYNSRERFGSMARTNDILDITSLAQLAPGAARSMVKDHLIWESRKERNDDIFISFTSSFLFALQHCVRKIATCQHTTAENCYIHVIDTSKYPPGTFSWTVDLLKDHGLDENDHPRLRHDYHEAEYLAQFELCVHPPTASESDGLVSMSQLITAGGLFQILPELDDETYRGELRNRLEQLRHVWYREEEAVTAGDIEGARRLALCFGCQWMIPMMIWVLAMKARPQDDKMVQAEFSDCFWGVFSALYLSPSGTDWVIGTMPTPYLFEDPQTDIPPTLTELAEWAKLMGTALRAQRSVRTGSHPGAEKSVDDNNMNLEITP
ncbi:hypothetical protein AYL99_00851 [Fonsecaea erecta]|uniref:DUF7587 domain-containing protein n=1 Tax=Fonsecaea erecta TaxID=1367422 RepID=A0A178ZYK6_9EURO|nr:hypothetical protein AYL99_00851 [Fonsecaea erecta]OAP64879.1 hypothetical protein AYL99_00851 [Fonsecaea erecta]